MATEKPESVRVSATECPVCKQPTQARYRPFCSRRCADVDLNSWFSEKYALPSEDPVDPDELIAALTAAERDEA